MYAFINSSWIASTKLVLFLDLFRIVMATYGWSAKKDLGASMDTGSKFIKVTV